MRWSVAMEPVMRSTTQKITQKYALGDRPVTPSVVVMTYQRLAYEDAAPTPEMFSDCAAVGRALHLPTGPREQEHPGRSERALDEIVVPDSLAELAREMHLHLG
jgi:hypothetical protein